MDLSAQHHTRREPPAEAKSASPNSPPDERMAGLSDEDCVALTALAADIRASTLELLGRGTASEPKVSPSAALVLTTLYVGGILRLDLPNSGSPGRDILILTNHLDPIRRKLCERIGLGRSNSPEVDPTRTAAPNLEDLSRILAAPSPATGFMLAAAVGAASAYRDSQRDPRTFLYLGQIDLAQEDLSREARVAAGLKLGNLIGIIELPRSTEENRLHGPACSAACVDMWRGYGWRVIEIRDGAQVAELYDGLRRSEEREASPRPTLVIVHPPAQERVPDKNSPSELSQSTESAQAPQETDGIALARAEVARLHHDAVSLQRFIDRRIRHAISKQTPVSTPPEGGGAELDGVAALKSSVIPTDPRLLKRPLRWPSNKVVPFPPVESGAGRNARIAADAPQDFGRTASEPRIEGVDPAINRAAQAIELARMASSKELTSRKLAELLERFDEVLRVDPRALQVLKGDELQTIRSTIAQAIKANAAQCTYKEARAIIYGLSVLRWNEKSDAESLLNVLAERLDDFDPHQVKEIRQAVWKLEYSNPRFCRALAAYFAAHIDTVPETSLVDTVGFLLRQDARDEARKLVEAAAPCFPRMSDGGMIKLANWAAEVKVKSRHVKEAIAETMANRMKSRPPSLSVFDASAMLHALAELDQHDPAVMDLFHRNFASRLGDLSLRGIQGVAWSYAVLGEKNRPFFGALAQTIIAADLRDQAAADWCVGVLAWSCARVNVIDKSLVQFIADRFAGRWNALPTGVLTYLAWGVCLDKSRPARGIVVACLQAAEGRTLSPEQHHQLRLAAVAAKLSNNSPCPAEIQNRAQTFAQSLQMNSFESSVYLQLGKLKPGVDIKPFHVVEGIVTDFLISVDQRRVILECDGVRYHQTANHARYGKDIIQDQVFKNCGYEVVHILDTEWFSCVPQGRLELLRKKLNLPPQ